MTGTAYRYHFAIPAGLALASLSPAGAAAQPASSSHAIEQLRAADSNGDGQISRAELLAARNSQWSRFDRNGDGYFTASDLPGFARSRWNGEKLAELRRRFDQDRDNRISRAEFVHGPTPVFEAADSNHDGLVSAEEMQAFASQVKG